VSKEIRAPGLEKRSLDFIQATTMVLSDIPQRRVDAVLFFSRSPEDSLDIVDVAAQLIIDKKASYLLLADQDGEKWKGKKKFKANPGKDYYIKQLQEKGVDLKKIILCPPPDSKVRGLHTKLEGESLINKAILKNFGSGVVIAHAHQLLRISLGVIKTLGEKDYNFSFWHAFPGSTNWEEKVGGSQGMAPMPRKKHILEETKRVLIYQQKGDIASFQEFLEYMEKRRF